MSKAAAPPTLFETIRRHVSCADSIVTRALLLRTWMLLPPTMRNYTQISEKIDELLGSLHQTIKAIFASMNSENLSAMSVHDIDTLVERIHGHIRSWTDAVAELNQFQRYINDNKQKSV